MTQELPSVGWHGFIQPPSLYLSLPPLHHYPLLLAALYWLVEQLQESLNTAGEGIELSVVKVTYMGSYPSIVFRLDNALSVTDVETRLERKAEEILSQARLQDFLIFAFQSKSAWHELSNDLMKLLFDRCHHGEPPGPTNGFRCCHDGP